MVKTDFPIYEEGKTRIITTHWAVRPLRFLDGSLHPCAMVPTIRFSVTGTTERPDMRVQVLGDYLLLWIIGEDSESRGVTRLYLISWKQGSVILVSIHYVSYIGRHNEGDDSSWMILWGGIELLI
jgi:hypothetical protein